VETIQLPAVTAPYNVAEDLYKSNFTLAIFFLFQMKNNIQMVMKNLHSALCWWQTIITSTRLKHKYFITFKIFVNAETF
jgi:hypothetical protein